MASRDLVAPTPLQIFAAAKPPSARAALRISALLTLSCAVLAANQCRAQDQDVAEAAKQERASKQAQAKKPKHVYTEDDLKRAQILTPEDRAQLEAQKNQPTPPTENSQQPADAASITPEAGDTPVAPLVGTPTIAIDASQIGVAPIPNVQPLPPDAPLGDVARYFRQLQRSQNLQRSAEFHLPFAEAPVLASPKPPLQPLRPPLQPSLPAIPVPQPSHPRFAPPQPLVKRSPFARPTAPAAAPRMNPSLPRTHPFASSIPSAGRGTAVSPAPPTVMPRLNAPVAPDAAARLNQITIRPGDSLWKIAAQNLGQALRWPDLLAANPSIRNPNHIVAGTQLNLPATISSHRAATNFRVRHGDTLSQIAQSQLGHASYAACIGQANPAIHDPDRIYAGQSLVLPARCKP